MSRYARRLYYIGIVVTYDAKQVEDIRPDQHQALNIFLGALHRAYTKALGGNNGA